MILNLKNKYELIILTSLYSFFFIYLFKDYISYKIAYAYQFLVILYLIFELNYTRFNKLLFFLNLPTLFIFYFGFEKEFVYLITLLILNSILILNSKDKIFFLKEKKIIIFILIYVLFLVAATNEKTVFLQDIIRSLYHFKYFGYKYGLLDLNVSYSAIIFTSIFLLLIKTLNEKNFYFYNIILILTIFLVFGSKVAVLFFFFSFISLNKFISKKILIFSFVFFNLFVFTLGYLAINLLPNPYIHSELYQKKEKFDSYKNSQGEITNTYYIQAKTYDEEICPNIENKFIKAFTTCPKASTKILAKYGTTFHSVLNRVKILGYSSYYKFYSIGFTTSYIFKNYKSFILPNPLKRLEEKKIIDTYVINSHLAAHNLTIGVFLKFGIIFWIIFLGNLLYFMFKTQDKIVLSFFVASAMLTIDTLVFFPLVLLHIFVKNKKYYCP